MNADQVLWDELRADGVSALADLAQERVVALVLRYGIWLPVDTYASAPWLAPFAVRRLRNRTDPRAPGPKRDLWGLPDELGYFADDNSLIKGVIKDLDVSVGSPYGARPIGQGLVCCHVWPGTTANPLLFSFVPNLVWLPKSLATYSDAHLAGPPHEAHEVLKAVSFSRFRGVPPEVGQARSEAAWGCLPAPSAPSDRSVFEFLAGSRVAALARQRTSSMIEFLEGTLSQGPMPERFSKRYHAGVGPWIDPSVWPVQQAVSEVARRHLIADLKACLDASEYEMSAALEQIPERDVVVAADVDEPASDELRLAAASEAELSEFGAWLVRTRGLSSRPVADYQSRVRRLAKGVNLSTLTPNAQATLKTAERAFKQFRG